jgi:hypothetical protein
LFIGEDENYYNYYIIPLNFDFNNLGNNSDSDNFALELIEDDIYSDIEKSLSYDIIDKFEEIIYNTKKKYRPKISIDLINQSNLNYKSFIDSIVDTISIWKLSEQKFIECEIDEFLRQINDTNEMTKIELLKYISTQINSRPRKNHFDMLFEIEKYSNIELSEEFKLKVI